MSEMIYGIHAVQALLERAPERFQEVFILKGREDKRLLPLIHALESQGVVIQLANRQYLDEKSDGAVHQGIIARVKPGRQYQENDLPDLIASLDQPFLLILDGVTDPHNLGACQNYRFMSENGMEAYVKYNYFHMEQRPRFKPDPFKAENFYYNEEQDFCICPMGQKMQRIGTRHVKTASGYVSENARYRAIRCEGCPLRCRCFKAKGNRTIELNHRLRKYKQKAKELLCSEEGLKHRGQRCIEPEAVFGQMKNNMNYKRFRHFGKDKVFMDFAFFAIAFNIKKMCAKMTKEGMDWLIRPFYELTVVLFRC